MAKKVLVVDDETDILKVIVFRVKKAGYEVLSATDGLAAVELAKKNKPDLVLLDVKLPGIDGIEACRRIRSEESLKNTKVIFLTASSESLTREKLAELKTEAVINKPFEIGHFLDVVRKALEQ